MTEDEKKEILQAAEKVQIRLEESVRQAEKFIERKSK